MGPQAFVSLGNMGGGRYLRMLAVPAALGVLLVP